MKFMKKVLSGLLATTVVSSMMALAPLYASAYVQYDVNNDGVVNNTDVTVIMHYLHGILDVTDISKLDINGNHIVDISDVNCLNAELLGLGFSLNNTVLPDNLDSMTTTDEYYIRHICNSSSQDTEYLMSLSVLNNGTSYTCNYTAAPTGSQTLSPSSNSGYVVKILSGSTVVGSGVIVADNVIATSADCIYSNNSFKSNISVVIFDGNGNSEVVAAEELHIPKKYVQPNYPNYEYNYGLIYFGDTYVDYSTCDFGTVINNTSAFYAHPDVFTMGFPTNAGYGGNTSNSNTLHQIYQASGNITSTLQAKRFGSNLPMQNGQAGSPVLATTNYNMGSSPNSCTETLGILSRSSGYGGSYSVRVTAPIIQFYLDNPYV